MTSIKFASTIEDYENAACIAAEQDHDLNFITENYPELLDLPIIDFKLNPKEARAIFIARKIYEYEGSGLQRSCNSHEIILSNWLIDRFLGDFVYVVMNARAYLTTYLVRINGIKELVTVYENDELKFATMLEDIQSKLAKLKDSHNNHMTTAAEFELMAASHISNSRSFAVVDMVDISQDELFKSDAMLIDAAKHKLFATKEESEIVRLTAQLESLLNV